MSTPNAVASAVLIALVVHAAYLVWADAKRRTGGHR